MTQILHSRFVLLPIGYSLGIIQSHCSRQSHPNVDKKLMMAENVIALKAPDRPFPVGTELGVLKWRFQTTDESFIPLTSASPSLLA